ncbi:HEAT repeat domain-containing protein [Psychrobacter sp. NG254]|uniref:HEAT repeat domain-containing protein n=1 Tax=Psychrobacter sp. NG254 TaxID=2782003 RepID=UPI00188713DB|nr:HEAT repeat domain-containing protein [Psychrobacter sp. NG254]MBF2719938.1 HEAT repeat domain-containing protein [Psychrobacter sp. NG254]
MKTITLPYWGQIIGLVSKANSTQAAIQKTSKQDGRSLFITRQQQASATVLYVLDQQGEQFSLSTTALPCAMQAITKIDDSTVVMIGDDGHLYQTDWQAKKVKKTSATSLLDAPENNNSAIGRAIAMAPLQDALAILYPKHIVVWPYQDSQASSTVIIEPYSSSIAASSKESALTALATSSDSSWLVIADKTGDVSSYQWTSDEAQLNLSSRKQLHQGKVNALCFEPVGQYFFSAGVDKCLYRTHVQGDLHPVDRAKSSQHSEMITALCVSDTRLFTAADDKSVKSWAFDKGQPNSCKEDLTKGRQIVLSSYAEQPTLIVVSADQSLRFIPIDHTQSASQSSTSQNSKLLPVTYIIKDGYQRISQLLTDASNNNDVSFKEGLALLQAQADNQTLELVKKLLADSDTLTANQALQLVEWIATTKLDKTAKILEQQLSSAHSAKVRLAAFHALADRASTAKRPLHYLEEAFKNRYYEEVVASALQGYLKVAMKDATSQRRILPVLRDALSHSFANIRKQALASLETLLPDNSPQADLMALDCNQSDIVQSGLIRLYQRGMLNHLEVSRQLMLLQNHRNTEIRQTAFYVSLLSQPKLIEALKQQGDTQTLRTLTDFDDFRLLRGTLLDNASSTAVNDNNVKQSDEAIRLTLSTQDFISQADSTQTSKSKSKAKTAKSKKSATESINLSNDTLEPLLQSLSNSHEDISFRAAYALACLQDKRAFGTLISLMSHDDSAIIRAGVATALGHLNIEDAKAVLPTLLDDKDAGVRQVAMQAYGKLADNALSWAATGFASKHQDIHEQSLALFLKHVAPDSSNSGDSSDKSAQMSSEMTDILLQALNNPFTSIRLEVVKVLLNRQFKQSSDNVSKNTSDSAIVDIIELLQQSLFEDVHQVAIEEWQRLLLAMTSKHKTNKVEETDSQKTNQAVLTLFFADTFAAIRKQAFDIALKQSKHLGFADVMLNALASPYADTKQLALTTVQARANTTQLTQLMPALVAMFADDSIELRKQALTVALALTDLQPTILADHSSLDDSSTDDQPNHHEALITAALNSPYPDIQLTVAQLLASQSRLYADEEQAQRSDEQAYQVFKHYLELPMPSQGKKSDIYTQWHNHVSQALFGLSKLAYPSKHDALGWYAKYLHHPDADFKPLAPKITQIVSFEDIDLLVKWQKYEKAIISQSASLCLAILGDARGQYFLTHDIRDETDNLSTLVAPMTPTHWLQAQHGLGITHARQLQPLFESESYAVAARLLLIFNDLQNGLQVGRQAPETNVTGTVRPNRLIGALSFADNDTAVVYANILARYPNDVQHPNNQQALSSTWQYLSDYLSRQLGSVLSSHSEVITMMMDAIPNTVDKGGIKRQSHNTVSIRASILTTVSTENLQQLANLSRHQQPLVRAQTISVICNLSELLAHDYYDDEDDVFETLQKWQRSLQALLSAHPVTAIVEVVGSAQTVGSSPTDKQDSSEVHYPYQSLAFGAWIGVIRADDDYYANSRTTDQAIRGLMWLATQSSQLNTNNNTNNDEDWRDSTSRVLLPLLNHSSFDTRELAWACLYKLDMPAKKLADYAMSTPYRDMVKRGLDLLLDTANNNAVQQQSKPSDTATVSSSADQQLIDLLKTNNHTLAEETYQLLKGRLGHLPASLLGLHTYCQSLLPQIVAEWKQVIVTPCANSQSPSVQRQDKLTFLLHAIKSDDWNAKYQALSQLVEFHDVLFADSTLFDNLFDFAEDAQSSNEKYRSWNLLVEALTSYQFINNSTLEGRFESGLESSFDIATAEQVANEAHLRLLALLDDPHINKPKQFIYSDIADLRNTNLVAPLLQRLESLFEHTPQKNKEERKYLFDTLVKISGYDQNIDDYLDEREDTRWLQRQHPRDSQVLLSLFTTLMSHSDYALAAQLLPSLAWVQSDDSDLSSRIDSALARAYEQMPAKYTFKLVETLAYRAKRRHSSIASLQNALRNKDADVQFAAAEGLAKCGHADGVNILMATIDYNPDAEFRSCSVLAIGELLGSNNQSQNTHSPNDSSPADNADKNLQVHTLYKAYDKLIKLAEDDEHYLQDVASEALGRLAQGGDFEHSTHIFELLKSHLSDPVLTTTNPAIIHWLNGLRWLNTMPAWEQIRSYIRTHLDKAIFFRPQRHAVWLLQMNNNDANKALILDILKQNNLDHVVLMVAYTAAQKTWGSLAMQVYPYDWAAIQSHNDDFIEETEHLSLKRIIDNSSIDDLAAFITQHGAHLPSDILIALQNAIMAKQDMPTSQLTALITSNNTLTQHIGLCYLTQYPTNYLDKEMVATLQQRFDTASEQWHTLIDTINRSPTTISNNQWIEMVEQVGSTIKQLVWLIMRHVAITTAKGSVDKAATKQIVAMLDWLNDARQPLTITSIPLLSTTVSGWWQQALLGLLARPVADDKVLSNIVPTLSSVSTTVQSPLTYDNQALLGTVIARIEQSGTSTQKSILTIVKNALKHKGSSTEIPINQQLLQWIRAKDADALYHCASNDNMELTVRIRAIEALGQLHDPNIEQWLTTLMAHENSDIQKLAYKVLRRWQRAMIRAQQKRPLSSGNMEAQPSSTIAAQNSQDSSQKSNQGEGDSQ